MSLTIYHNQRSFNNAFNREKEALQMALLDDNIRTKWGKQQYDASSLFPNITTHDDFIHAVTRQNVFRMIFANMADKPEDEIFPCEVFVGNEAWVGVDNVEYRYFTRKSPKHVAVGYTILDFLRAFQTNCDVNSGYCFLMARRELVDLLNVSYDESDWEKAEEQKYENNIRLLKRLKGKRAQKHYPNLHQKLDDYFPALEKILKNGLRFINPKRKDKNGYASFVFYSTSSGLSKKEFEKMLSKLKGLDLLIVESKEDTYLDKNSYNYVTKDLQFFSFPPYSEEFFRELEEKLGSQKE
ncbi:hypothetical protein [Weizmannia acidilactici]|uniref:hypothetical protein n=1 Tax=Weizmannia acidilactici TaxID=2607726 RepID=UPI00124CBEF8|nr:hypothetical protein [Weizmannia acidilactici]GER74814.1 hypothetical protein BpPP18_28810 [Weizmannia acidilactici]